MIEPTKECLEKNLREKEKKVLKSLNDSVMELMREGIVPAKCRRVILNLNEGRIERKEQIGFEGHG